MRFAGTIVAILMAVMVISASSLIASTPEEGTDDSEKVLKELAEVSAAASPTQTKVKPDSSPVHAAEATIRAGISIGKSLYKVVGMVVATLTRTALRVMNSA